MARIYEIDGEKYPSVTTILGVVPNPWLDRWKANTPNADEISARSMIQGTLFHFRVESFLANQFSLPTPTLDIDSDKRKYIDDELKENVNIMFSQFEEFMAEYPIRPWITEAVVYNKQYKYAGTFDLAASYDNSVWILDIKTAKSIWPDYEAQLAAYSKCPIPGFQLHDGPLRIAIMRFNAKTGWQFKEMNIEKGWDAFLKALEMYNKKEAK